MKLSAAQTTSFLKSPDPLVRIVLVYGPDVGLVSERALLLAKKKVPDLDDPFRVARLSVADVANDPARLHDEMASLSLGGGSRLLWIRSATESIQDSVSALIEDPPLGDSFLLIEAGDLEKRSKLRALCEGETRLAAAIACYTEEGAQRSQTIASLLEAEGLRASRDVLALLSETLPEDRVALRSEMQKLALYALGQKDISEDDVRAVLQSGSSAALDDLAFATGAGETSRVGALLDILFAEQTSPVAILRTLQRHFTRLLLARAHMDAGLNAREAAGKLQPKLFWKIEAPFIAQLQKWPAARLEAILDRLFTAEAAVKKTATPDEALTIQLCLQIAAQVAR